MRERPPSMKHSRFMPADRRPEKRESRGAEGVRSAPSYIAAIGRAHRLYSPSMYSFTMTGYSESSPNDRRMKKAPHFCSHEPRMGMLRLAPATICGRERPTRKKSHDLGAVREDRQANQR